MAKRSWFLGLAVWIVAPWVQAEGLTELYQQALASDPVIAAARAAREAGREKRLQGEALKLPTIGVAADTFWNRIEAGPVEKSFNTNQWGVKLTQPLYRPQHWASAEAAALASDLAELEWRDAEQQLIVRLARAWFDVLKARAAQAAAEGLRSAAAAQLELAKASFAVGSVTVVDVHEAQSRFDLAEARVIAARNAVAVAEEALQAITGEKPRRYPELRQEVRLAAPDPADAEHWAEAARAENLAVLKARLGEAMAHKELERRRAANLPAVDLEALFGNQRLFSQATFSVREVEAAQVGVKFALPLYAGGALSSQVREAVHLLTEAERRREAAERQAALAARQAFLNITSGLARVAALEAALASSLKNLEATRTGFEVGVRINLDVLNAQAQVADARTQLAEARFDTLLAMLQLKAAVARLDAAALAELDKLFSH